MATKRVIYTRADGCQEVRIVPEGLPAKRYHEGILIGPPVLDLPEVSDRGRVSLNNTLVETGIVNWDTSIGRRSDIIRIVQSTLDVDRATAKELMKFIIAAFQREDL